MNNIIKIALIFFLAVGCKSQKDTVANYEAKSQDEPRERRQGGQRQGPPSIDEIFKMDADNDGRLSQAELKGPLLRDFSKIDTDGDGFISRTELENAPKPQRGKRPN